MKRFLFPLLCVLSFYALRAQPKDDDRPVVDASSVKNETATNNRAPTIFVVSDSTARSNAPMRGWGDELKPFFDAEKVNVLNRAMGGRSSRTFIGEGRWANVLQEIKAGDIVLVQFGHNDVGAYDDPKAKDRPSLKGEGEETAEITRKDGVKETVHTFGWYLRKYGTDAKAKGATVVFCSMVPHKDWVEGHIKREESKTFVVWTRNAAEATGAYFVNLNEISALAFEKLGQEKVESLFQDARTHSTPAGAVLNARSVVAGLRGLPGAPFDKYLSKEGKAVEPAR